MTTIFSKIGYSFIVDDENLESLNAVHCTEAHRSEIEKLVSEKIIPACALVPNDIEGAAKVFRELTGSKNTDISILFEEMFGKVELMGAKVFRMIVSESMSVEFAQKSDIPEMRAMGKFEEASIQKFEAVIEQLDRAAMALDDAEARLENIAILS